MMISAKEHNLDNLPSMLANFSNFMGMLCRLILTMENT